VGWGRPLALHWSVSGLPQQTAFEPVRSLLTSTILGLETGEKYEQLNERNEA
jgi:hypothetical protein